MTGLDILFLIASVVAAGASLVVVTRPNPMHSAFFMMIALFALSVIFLLLMSTFVAVIQVLLYAGAIMVLFVFIIMLLNPSPEEAALPRAPLWQRAAGLLFSLALLFALGYAIYGGDAAVERPFSERPVAAAPNEPPFGTTEYFGSVIYTRYLLAFEMISLLILGAIAGVIVLAKKRLDTHA